MWVNDDANHEAGEDGETVDIRMGSETVAVTFMYGDVYSWRCGDGYYHQLCEILDRDVYMTYLQTPDGAWTVASVEVYPAHVLFKAPWDPKVEPMQNGFTRMTVPVMDTGGGLYESPGVEIVYVPHKFGIQVRLFPDAGEQAFVLLEAGRSYRAGETLRLRWAGIGPALQSPETLAFVAHCAERGLGCNFIPDRRVVE